MNEAPLRSKPSLAIVLLVLLSSCAEDLPQRLASPAQIADSDPCLQLFDAAWVHVVKMKQSHPSLVSEVASTKLMSATLSGDGWHRRFTYELERD